jgi:predicted ATPase/DNA-binding winged helix-turn-helix (wHTH) protein
MSPRRSYQFGSFRLDAAGRVLYRDGQRVALTPKAIDVLIVLVQARDRLVGKDELLSTVWAGTVVEEGTLASHVSMLRKALGANGGRDFIETLPKRGYRFIGPVVEASAPAGSALTFLFAAMEDGTDAAQAGRPTTQADALLREVVTRHGGQVVRAVEDAFCAAFPEAGAAVRAAVDAQRSLCQATLRLRMGLHSGTVVDAHDDEPSRPTLARAALVMEAAQGGQILVTAATLAQLGAAPPPNSEWRDLGDHTLRGFARPERLYQLCVAGLRSEFPPIRTPEAMRTNLPPSLTMFVGRQPALAQVRELLRRSRMVTLTGAGGIGKTRLSLEAAGQLVDAFPDGVWLVELASLADGALVPQAIAQALGARGEGDTPPMVLIESRLRARRALLVLDNCEHVLDEAAPVAHALLRALPQVQLLATSRQALGIEGEAVYRVPSLTLTGTSETSPATPSGVLASEAGQLFVERATAVQLAFSLTERNAPAVAQVCRRLDGIPLAIELAAARLTALSAEELAQHIDDRFSLLTGGLRTALPRQRTLRALVDWSYELLPAAERAVLDALAVFAGGFSLEAAQHVCADDAGGSAGVLDALGQLVEKSLLIAEMQDGSATRYRLLETIRQYASEKLVESGRAETARRRHFEYFEHLATAGASALGGPMALEWLDRLEATHDNLRAALDGSANADPAGYARLAGALRNFWDTRGHYIEGWARLARALHGHAARDRVRLEVLIGAGLVAFRLADARSHDLLNEAILLAREIDDAGRESEATFWLTGTLNAQRADDIEPLIQRTLALAKTAGDRRLEVLALVELGRAARDRGQLAKARGLYLDAVRVGIDAGCVIDTPTALHYAGQCALEQLDFAAARRLLDDALVQHRRVGNLHDAAQTLSLLGQLALNEQRLDEARALSSESLRVFRALHDPKCTANTSIFHARVLNALGDGKAALPHAQSAAEIYGELDFPLRRARALYAVGCIHAALGQDDASRRALFDGLAEQRRAERDAGLPDLLEMIAAMHAEDPIAPQLLGAAAALRQRLNIPLLPSESMERERRLADVRARHPDAMFGRAFAAGHTQTRDEAIRSAMGLEQR